MKSTLQILIDARKLIEKPENWCQHFLCKLPDGSGQNGRTSDDATAFCMNGAIYAACENSPVEASPAIRALEDATYARNVTVWNDEPDRTHAEVVAAYERAIEAERAKVSA